jgi:hypothetical protein
VRVGLVGSGQSPSGSSSLIIFALYFPFHVYWPWKYRLRPINSLPLSAISAHVIRNRVDQKHRRIRVCVIQNSCLSSPVFWRRSAFLLVDGLGQCSWYLLVELQSELRFWKIVNRFSSNLLVHMSGFPENGLLLRCQLPLESYLPFWSVRITLHLPNLCHRLPFRLAHPRFDHVREKLSKMHDPVHDVSVG